MQSMLIAFLLFPINFILFSLNLAFCGSLVFLGGLVKFFIPIESVQEKLYAPMHMVYRLWSINNRRIMFWANNIDWQVQGAEDLDQDGWYLLIANHQSWLDILVLTIFALDKIPEPKFFLKDSLKKLPFLGMACWSLEMPFMKRYSKAFLVKNPHLKGQDIETTKASCKAFEHNPTTIINFVEGTRLTLAKHRAQSSPFKYLLRPKAGGIAFTLQALGDRFDKILNITLVYPDNPGHVMKDMLKGNLKTIIIHVEPVEVNKALIGDYFHDPVFKEDFQQWLNTVWTQKDHQIELMLAERESQTTHHNFDHQIPLGR